MVDSVKNYGITGVGAVVELGKQGPKIDGSNSEVIAFTDKDGTASPIAIAEGVNPEHSVALSQLSSATANKVAYVTTTVSYDSGNVVVGNVSADTYIYSVSVEKGAGNWTGADASTEITVGDSEDSAKLFSGFDVATQTTTEPGYVYTVTDTISIFVTPGGSRAGTAKVIIWYTGTIE